MMGAGSGIVQFVREDPSGCEFAVKFFLVDEKFTLERRMHTSSPLRAFLPAAEVHDGDTWLDTNGHALPPCIVTERGESLAEWSQVAKPDLDKSVTVRLPFMHVHHALHITFIPIIENPGIRTCWVCAGSSKPRSIHPRHA